MSDSVAVPDGWQEVSGVVVEGHGVASGQAGDERFPAGTLALQAPHFRDHSIDLSDYFLGTLNISIAPYRPVIRRPRQTLRAVKWAESVPPEDFSFFDCQVVYEGSVWGGLVYYPHPETKPEHEQPLEVLEVIAPYISGLNSGQNVELRFPSSQLGVSFMIEGDSV